MVSLSLNSIKQIMKTMVDTHGFDRVLSKVSRHHLVFEEMLAECITLAVCGVVQKLRRDVYRTVCLRGVRFQRCPLPSASVGLMTECDFSELLTPLSFVAAFSVSLLRFCR